LIHAGFARSIRPVAAIFVSKSPFPQVLIVARDENIGSLMESLVDCAGYRPVHPAADERPLAALARIRPDILLLDCDHTMVLNEALHEAAHAAGSRVVLFSAAHPAWELDRFAQRRGLRSVALPANPTVIGKTLDDAMR
jgi:DNA-binding NtrC family response regulator